MTLGYYPFGLTHKGYNNVIQGGNGLAQQFKFGGKEYNQELGLDWYDVSARNYDPALGRWMNIDPLAEQMRRHSPYNYAFDNPIFFVDPDGMAPMAFQDPIRDKNGKIVAYRVEKGQGPSQIAADLNSTGDFDFSIDYLDVVENNSEKFTHIENVNDINDEGFSELDINEGDIISIDKVVEKQDRINEIDDTIDSNETQIVELESENEKLDQEIDSIQKSMDAIDLVDGSESWDPKAGEEFGFQVRMQMKRTDRNKRTRKGVENKRIAGNLKTENVELEKEKNTLIDN